MYLLAMLLLLSSSAGGTPDVPESEEPVRIGVVGLTHGHVGWILGREDRGDVQVVGIAEPDRALARRYAAEYGFSMDLVYESVEEMLDSVSPVAITDFRDVASHLATVEAAAPRGIHVMVEKPLHFSLEAALRMKELADSAGIHVLTNYETTWYPSTTRAGEVVDEGTLGSIRKVVVHDGHQGPAEIGVGPEFLTWLTDPERNGGGAIVDFGCYGADLITWLMNGARPTSVTAVTQTIKPSLYPLVDDEATIILTYPDAQRIIQASWNWPYSRKDMEIYGTDGYFIAENARDVRFGREGSAETEPITLDPQPDAFQDPFAYLAAVVRGNVEPAQSLSSLEVNLVVAEILDAARRSAREGKTVTLPEQRPW